MLKTINIMNIIIITVVIITWSILFHFVTYISNTTFSSEHIFCPPVKHVCIYPTYSNGLKKVWIIVGPNLGGFFFFFFFFFYHRCCDSLIFSFPFFFFFESESPLISWKIPHTVLIWSNALRAKLSSHEGEL